MDYEHIEKLLTIARSSAGFARAQQIAAQALDDAGLPPFPKNACAATLSAFLRLAGINVPMTLGAGKLAHILHGPINSRHWVPVPVGDQRPGDVGVTFDDDPRIPGADHIYLVVETVNRNEMVIADNQATSLHTRFASGYGRTPTEYFLRVPPAPVSLIFSVDELPELLDQFQPLHK